MNILFLAPHPYFSLRGTPIAERALLEVLTDRGHSVDVLTYHEGVDPEIADVAIHRIPSPPGVRDVPPGFSWKKVVCDALLLFEAVRLVRAREYDLVHAVEEASFVAWTLRRCTGIPFVYDMDSLLLEQTVDQFPPARSLRSVLARLEARVMEDSAAVIAVCRLLEEHALAAAPGSKVYRLEDASLLDEADEDAEDLRRLTGSDGPFVLYVGNLQPVQGIDLLLTAFRPVVESHPEAELVLIGGSPERIAYYSRKTEELGIESSVHLVGPRPLAQLAGYLRQAEVLVSPRKGGVNTPMKIYSYLDSGRPVLATRLSTHTQVLDDRVSYLVTPDPDEMAEGLITLLDQPELRQELGSAGRALVEREFSPEAFRRKAGAIYEEIETLTRNRAPDGDRRPAPAE